MHINLIMISGPYTGITIQDTKDNIEKARLKSLELVSKKGRFGWFPITPHLNTGGFEIYESVLEGINILYWYNGYAQILSTCKAVLMMPNWEKSKGAVEEHRLARIMDKPIYYDVESIPDVPFDCGIKGKLNIAK